MTRRLFALSLLASSLLAACQGPQEAPWGTADAPLSAPEDGPVTIYGVDGDATPVVFADMEDALAWADSEGLGDLIREKLEDLARERAYVVEHGLMDLPPNHPDLVAYDHYLAATYSGEARAAPGWLFDNPNCGGDSVYVGYARYTLGSMNYRAESFCTIVPGTTGMPVFTFDRTYWRGGMSWFLSIPVFNLFDWQENRVASIL